MPSTDDNSQRCDVQRLNALAGVISGDLIRRDPQPMTTDEVCAEAERDPQVRDEREEVVVALWLLVAYGLVTPQDGGLWRATLSAMKAEAISF